MSRREVSRTDGAGTGRHEGAGAQPSGQRGLGRLGLTSRAFILAAAVVLVFVMITPSLGVYFKQRSQLADLTAQQAQQTRTIAQLQDELKRWDDPDYVRTQARSQLGWVVPGETGYRVIGKNGKVLGAGAELDASGDTTGPAQTSQWWQKMVGSVRTADSPARTTGR
ncbi:FtsB family cell division protein [Acidipropionibacterium jensenii]|uniref:FtsB family cell division protein n=1 Tax=Acidipropionibacterium jensenii TaxID=1749 RepID=UPI000BC35475|nr:septum formation initiator family protein [Acidipropionibacterium jensenii]